MSNSPPFEKVEFDANTVVFMEGDEGDAAYLVTSGEVAMRKKTMSEAPQILGTIKKGDIFGELALFDGRPRIASAVTQEKTSAIRISRKEFLSRLADMDPVLRSVVLKMVFRNRTMAEEVMYKKGEANWTSNFDLG